METIFNLMIIVGTTTALLLVLSLMQLIMWGLEKLFPGLEDWLDEKVWGR